MVILLIRVAFAIPNKLRDKKFAEGDQRYDPSGITYEDMTDKQNLHFRYLSKSSCYTPRRVSRGANAHGPDPASPCVVELPREPH